MFDGLTFDVLMAITTSMAPLVSFGLIMVFTRKSIKASVTISLIASTLAWLAAFYLFVHFWPAHEVTMFKASWLISDSYNFPFGYYFDSLSLLMLMIVVTISLLIQIYSIGYMAGDPGKSRYYACLSLFSWSMINLVIAPGLLQLYIFWELVGVSSYLLIGYYFEKWSASEAGKKAFVMTRAGDIGFFIGILILLINLGHLSIGTFTDAVEIGKLNQVMVTISAILIFCGAVGKSAQFPLMTWLPDAMEGPTPVSALLHSATMVAAGVYLISRVFPFFEASSAAMMVMLIIGTITMLLSSTMAMVAKDIKQVWAFSTVSQLGFMIMGLGAGAYFAGVFHLTTHAFFKALLFLCAGVFIHHFNTNDFFEMSKRGARKYLIPMITVTIGVLALSGIWPLSGFFSKEAIMGALYEKGAIWLIAGLLGALMTAYYSFRVIFVMWRPKLIEEPAHDAGHSDGHHETPAILEWVMLAPLIFLALVTVFLGFFQNQLYEFLTGHPLEHHTNNLVLVLALGCAFAGIAWAWFEFGAKASKQEGFLTRMPALEKLFANRWYMDDFYRWLLDNLVYKGFTNLFTRNDRYIIDGGIDGISNFTIYIGRVVSMFQAGLLQYNLYLTFIVVALMGLYFFLV